jgi:hypothetical protein
LWHVLMLCCSRCPRLQRCAPLELLSRVIDDIQPIPIQIRFFCSIRC